MYENNDEAVVAESTASSIGYEEKKAATRKDFENHGEVASSGRSIRWIERNKICIILALAIVTAAVLIPTLLLVAFRSPPPPPPTTKHQEEHHPGFPPTLDNKFNNSVQANPYTPPLSQPFPYGTTPIRGINLGGWLVIEPFITPSLFDQFPPSANVVDEYTLCQKLGPKEARRQIQNHYETFITEEDFEKIARMGFNHVRIPMGHWSIEAIEGEPYVSHLSWQYLLRAVQWARKYGLRVMVELHTAPGSQNGWNHSGRYGQIGWLNGTQGEANAIRTLKVVEKMVEFFSKPEWHDVAPIFGVLNEPAIYHIETNRAKDWYRNSHDAIRNITGEDGGPYLTYHDGFLGLDSWNGFFDQKHYKRVFLETHMYIMFDEKLVSMPREKKALFPCHNWRKILKNSTRNAAPTMVGEFSVATNDCGKYLNGIGLGTRYENTFPGESEMKQLSCPTCTCEKVEDWKNWDQGYRTFLNSFMEYQMDSFETSSVGWFFWTYKTENHTNPHWDYLLGWEKGWAPQDVNNKTHKCANS
ncbi:glycoside hydrolase superfamily [Zychaea mexicana]|uniref:glycoside hydrolase superfamily n=1 Tax=Zychaea mexicana TaxID=64656 RepID=UPI0022FE6CE2|nr:glycoside hydrolase superfamily [Zychaea mexicana]KAI9493932.1 glycoside hydrolase superfamily [Zychaea mexicana]